MLTKDESSWHSEMKKEEVDRRRSEKTILKSAQKWNLRAQLGQPKTGQAGKGLLRSQMWSPNNLALFIR